MGVAITVKLYGTLCKWVPGYDPGTGCTVQLTSPPTVADLIDHLGIPIESVGIVSVDGQLADKADVIPDRSMVKVFHPIFGG